MKISLPNLIRMAAKKIGTHNGTFHCDESLACFMLKLLPEYKNAEIIRTRDPKLLEECDIVVDVGAVYDPSRLRFDHHQKTFDHTFNSIVPSARFTTKLSSAGLIYVHFGKEIIAQALGITDKNAGDVPDELINILYDKLYEKFIEEIDGVDNGIEQRSGPAKYAVTTTLSNRVGNLNPWWNDQKKDENAKFHEAVALTGKEFIDKIQYLYKCWWPARDLVRAAVAKRCEVDSSGCIIVFEQGGCPWKDHLFELEKELSITSDGDCLKYVLYPDERNGNWMINAVPVENGSFESRLALPAAWRGLRNEELSTLVGIEKCVFCHASGFCGAHETLDGALTMVRKSLALSTANGS